MPLTLVIVLQSNFSCIQYLISNASNSNVFILIHVYFEFNKRTFFCSFPKDEELRKKWLHAVNRPNFKPSASAKICSNHFLSDDFDKNIITRKKLLPNSVPTVFGEVPLRFKKVHPPSSDIPIEDNHLRTTDKSSELVQNNKSISENPPVTQKITYNVPVWNEKCPNEDDDNSPINKILKRRLTLVNENLHTARKKIKLLNQARRRLRKKNSELENVINTLKESCSSGGEKAEVLKKCAGGITNILKRKMAGGNNKKAYTHELRAFALTLHYYSPKAYNFVRKSFDTCLPQPRTIEKWHQRVLGKHGFTHDDFELLEGKAKNINNEGKEISNYGRNES